MTPEQEKYIQSLDGKPISITMVDATDDEVVAMDDERRREISDMLDEMAAYDRQYPVGDIVLVIADALDAMDEWQRKFDALIAAVFEQPDDVRDRILARAKELEATPD